MTDYQNKTKKMKQQVEFIDSLYKNFLPSIKEHLKNRENSDSLFNNSYMNSNHGKTALIRKIIYLKTELNNLEILLKDWR